MQKALFQDQIKQLQQQIQQINSTFKQREEIEEGQEEPVQTNMQRGLNKPQQLTKQVAFSENEESLQPKPNRLQQVRRRLTNNVGINRNKRVNQVRASMATTAKENNEDVLS